MAFRKTTGERGGLAPGGALRGFQFFAQLPILLFQPLILFLQLLNPPPGLVAFLPHTVQLLRQFPDAAERVEGPEKQMIL